MALICQEETIPTIVAATDKMLTAQVTFEMTRGKKFELAFTIYAYGEGNSSDGIIIARRARARIQADDIKGVEKAAEIYAEEYRKYRRESFEHEVLAPIGLTLAEFFKRATDLPESLVDRVDRTMREGYLPISDRPFGGSTIVAGVDEESHKNPGWVTAHIFVIEDPGRVTCMDEVGFAAVGSGAQQAEAYLMLSRYTPDRDFNTATLAAYSAKRQAENAPYVGRSTDLMQIHSGGIGAANLQNFTDWDRIVKRRSRSELAANERAIAEMTKYMEALNVTAQPPATQAQAPQTTVAAKPKRVRGRSKKSEPKD